MSFDPMRALFQAAGRAAHQERKKGNHEGANGIALIMLGILTLGIPILGIPLIVMGIHKLCK